ncbi:MAG TPA: phosphoribosyltransferase family protein, partial [Mycobacteriales bacterium]|nr:phosphoribosyltransferase family protein [Mycobacteriales bacterium]
MTATLLTALADLALPATCAGCGAARTGLCRSCAAALTARVRVADPSPRPPGLPPCWASAQYAGAVRAVLLAYKEHDRRDVLPALGGALGRAVAAGVPRGPVVLVPVPSSPAAVRARGGDHVDRLARAAADRLRRDGGTVRVARLLAAARGRRDSAGLGPADRRANLAGAFRWSGRPADVPGTPVVLVDDLVTTGATLAEAAALLRTVGVGPVYAAVVAATVRRVPITACRPSR